MKDKFKKLFPYGINFDSAGLGTHMQNRYDEIGHNQITYIENATDNFAVMYEEIKRDIECLTRWIDNHGDAFPMTATWKDMRASKIELLKRARGE